MKPSSLNDTNYSLHNIDNFKQLLDYNPSEILIKYNELITEYLNYFVENNKIKNPNYLKFIVIRGIETVTHVFHTILHYTKNLEITYLHCQKAYYFYIEFICQISEDQNVFLQLSSKDAIMYVYKKTIYEINNEYKKNITDLLPDELNKINYVTEYIILLKTLVSIVINNEKFLHKHDNTKLIEQCSNLSNKIILTKIDIINLPIIHLFFEKISNNYKDFNKVYEFILTFLKKINRNNNNNSINFLKIKNKLFHEDSIMYLKNETPDKFVNWLLLY
jgi:hypothetical protein